MNFQLMASMMCADYRNLQREVETLDAGGIDSFHIDIMDGRYVPNYAMSLNDLRCIRSLTSKPLDVHLMVEHPSNTIEIFINNLAERGYKGAEIYVHNNITRIVYGHYENQADAYTQLQKIAKEKDLAESWVYKYNEKNK